jgi:DNA-binding NarL/FixJ family response regulator
LAQLTARELQLLPYIARGLTVRQTAEIVHLSPKTVDVHKMNIMAKLGIHDRVTLARFAIREGLIPVWED